MGNEIFYMRPPEECPKIGAPMFRSPFTDLTAQIGHTDGDRECLPFELRLIDCAEAHGKELARKKCKYLYQDFVECNRRWKQMARVMDMTDQRYHLWFQGMIGRKERVPLYSETPRYDGYLPNFDSDDTNWKSG